MSQPVSYLQTDSRWGGLDYSAPGEKTTIAASGCGPTAMAMVLATWADKTVTPKTECAWALAHGYKAPRQGTYYGYFEPAGARYGLQVTRLNWTNLYGNATSAYHAQVRDALDRGDLVIACMGKGLWTSSGHYVLVWKVEGNMVFINDPASTRSSRTRGDWNLFCQQVKYYWVIEKPQGKENDMEGYEIVNTLTDREAYELMQKAQRYARTLPEADWSKTEGWWEKAQEEKILSGGPEALAKRCEVAAILGRLGLI